ncbi:2-phosphoglycerate kinase [Ornithinibacillus halotolerans]|uniref:Adenylate kinase n=1 Tax=Ornithinibacillus halotolerans TaxID=1274357 RepID=A0A916RW98_9BACI|nr:2-phosphoglycerate kinase [Ornithinibacillus halotolerans]GGA72253.1 adenylate kinase [Ornithinibacillus halotolerans]
MVILISAVGSTGKTVMAQKLLEKYHIPYLSIDHLKMGIYRGYNNCGFTPLSSTEVIAEKLWPIIKGIIKTNIENNQHIILEGCYLLPQHLAELEKPYMEKVIPVYFGFSSNYIKTNFMSKILAFRDAVETRNYPEERTIAEIIQEHENFKQMCEKYDMRYFEINQDYEQEMNVIYSYFEIEKSRIEGLMIP